MLVQESSADSTFSYPYLKDQFLVIIVKDHRLAIALEGVSPLTQLEVTDGLRGNSHFIHVCPAVEIQFY